MLFSQEITIYITCFYTYSFHCFHDLLSNNYTHNKIVNQGSTYLTEKIQKQKNIEIMSFNIQIQPQVTVSVAKTDKQRHQVELHHPAQLPEAKSKDSWLWTSWTGGEARGGVRQCSSAICCIRSIGLVIQINSYKDCRLFINKNILYE